MIHSFPQSELPLIIFGGVMSAWTSICFIFVALLQTTITLLLSTDLRSFEVSSICLYFDKIFLIAGLKGLLAVMNGIIVFGVVVVFFGCSRWSQFLENALSIALQTKCVG